MALTRHHRCEGRHTASELSVGHKRIGPLLETVVIPAQRHRSRPQSSSASRL